MHLYLGKCITKLEASKFNLDLSGGEGEPLVVGAEKAAGSQCPYPALEHALSQAEVEEVLRSFSFIKSTTTTI